MGAFNLMRWVPSGICLGLSFLHPILSPLFVVGVVLFIQSTVRAASWREVLTGAFIVGVFRYGGAIAWVWDTYPIDWLGVAPKITQLALIGLVWFTNVLFLAIGMVGLGAAIFFLYRCNHRYILAFPILLVLSELLGSLMFSIWSLGPGSALNLGFSFGYAAHAVSWIPGILPIAVGGGAYALSLFSGLIALSIFLLLSKNDDRGFEVRTGKYLLLIAAICFICAIFYVSYREDKPLQGTVIAIETHFDSALLSAQTGPSIKRQTVLAAVESAFLLDPDIVLLPEDARFVSSFRSVNEVLHYLHNYSSSSKTLLVDSARTQDSGTTVLRAHFFDLSDNRYYYTDKQHLAPQGEYLPYWLTFLLKLTGNETLVQATLIDRSYRPGPMDNYENIPPNIPSVLFCFESVLPTGVKNIYRPDTGNLILHPVSHTWFHDSAKLRYQLDRMLRAQAIWNNVNIIQAGNMSQSAIYRPNGQRNDGQVLLDAELYTLKSFH